jgi:capsular polysaccharide biosynthesis protein
VETLTLTELGARMAHRWRTLVAGGVVGLVLAAAGQAALPTRYEATTVVHVDAGDPAQVDMAAERAVVLSRRVTTEALDALGDPGAQVEDLEDAIGATAVKDSRLLRISCTGASPGAAARGADAVAHAYLASRSVDAAAGAPGPAVDPVVIDPARAPTSAVGPGAASSALGGAVLGLLIAAPVASRSRAAHVS